jgi:hypothetical protein
MKKVGNKMVTCQICKKKLKQIQYKHLNLHNITIAEYKNLYSSEIISDETKLKLSLRRKGKHHTEESKNKMKHPRSEESKLKQGNTLRGKKRAPFSEEWKQNLSKAATNPSEETRNKMSIGNTGKIRSEAFKQNLRELRLHKATPTVNINACKIIEEYGKQHGYNFQHGINGGEIRIIGYALDGYDKEKNIIIEYYEKRHLVLKQQLKDKTRKINLINHLHCKFIEIFFNGNIVITN